MTSHLANLILDVDDLDRSLAFYRGLLELSVERLEDVDGNRLAYLATGPTCLMLIEQPIRDRNPELQRSGGMIVKFYVAGLRQVARRLQNGATELLQPLDEPVIGERTLLVRDPDGYAVLLAEPIAQIPN